jgi:hypothetical protein
VYGKTGTGGGHAAPVVVALIDALIQYSYLPHID